jgi:hypothetical protein
LEQAHAGQVTPFADFIGQAAEKSLDVYLGMAEVRT